MKVNFSRLNKEKNPAYYSIVEEYNEIIDSLNPVRKKVFDFRIPEIQFLNMSIPLITPFNKLKYRKELSKIGSQVEKLQSKYIKWNKRAWEFCDSPRYVLTADNDFNNALKMQHYNAFLLGLINQLNADISLLVSDYNLRYSEVENTANYWLSTTAWLLTFVALIVSLYSLYLVSC